MSLDHTNGWNEYQKLVLSSLKRLEDAQIATDSKIGAIQVDVGQLKVKASLWGAVSGAVMGIATRLIPGIGGH